LLWKPWGFPMVCRPMRWPSPLVGQACGWSARGGLTCDGGRQVMSKPSKGKVMDFESPRNAWGMNPGQQSPWSSKHRGCKPWEQECWGKARSVKLRGVNPGLEQDWGRIPAGSRGDLAPCVAKPMVGSSSSGPTHHGGSPGVPKPSATQWIWKAQVG
jgi:hypothetical protein